MTVRPDNWFTDAKHTKRLTLAVQFWHSARILLEQEPRRWMFIDTTSHLLAHSVELCLKHFLENRISASQIDKTLGKNRHSLRALLERCLDEGLEVDMIEALTVLQFEKAHTTHFFRYGKASGMLSASPYDAISRIGHLIDRVAGAVGPLRACYGPDETDFVFPAAPILTGKVDKLVVAMLAEALEKQSTLGRQE